MRLTCSACGAHGSIELFSADTDARRAHEIAAGLPGGLGPIALRYVALFRPGTRGLTWDRVVKLLTEVSEMVTSGFVERSGKRYPASPAVFAGAIQQMLDTRERLDLPLKTHGYLITIVVGESPRAAARAETAQEGLNRMASSQRDGSRSRAIAELSGEIARRKRFGEVEMSPEERDRFLKSKADAND